MFMTFEGQEFIVTKTHALISILYFLSVSWTFTLVFTR